MSLLKLIKAQFGISNTATQNFTLTAENADGTMKLARGNAGATTQDILNVDAAGNVNAPVGLQKAGSIVQALSDFIGSNQSLSANGYQKFPGGLILQWGYNAATQSTSTNTVVFPIAFPNACDWVSCVPQLTGATIDGGYSNVTSKTATQFVTSYTMSKYWFAIGH